MDPKVVLFAAYERETGLDETSRWLDDGSFTACSVEPALDRPLYVDEGGDVLLVVTGIGSVTAALTVERLTASEQIDCSNSYFVTVGSAGGSPETTTLGSVVVNDAIADWDQKHRWWPTEASDDEPPVDTFSFKPRADVCKECDPGLVRAARSVGTRVGLADTDHLWDHRQQFPHEAARAAPSVAVGTSVSGSEFWHGRPGSEQARLLADRYGESPYRTTEMEGFGTATALDRRGLLDRYLSIRGVSNFDRPQPGQDAVESLRQDELALETCLENVYRVGSALVSRIVEDWDQWREGVPATFETAPV